MCCIHLEDELQNTAEEGPVDENKQTLALFVERAINPAALVLNKANPPGD